MHALVMLLICSSTLLEYVVSVTGAPGMLKFVPEIGSGILAALVLFAGLRNGFASVSPKYWVAFGLAAFVLVAGALANSVGSGPIITGTRTYVRAIPLFFAAAVVPFTEKQIRQQLALVLAIGLLQLPIAGYQRYLVYSTGRFSGDEVQGTVLDSGVLSIMLVCTVAVLLGFFMRKRISLTWFIALFFILLIPTTINETKGTVLLLPIALLSTIAAGAPSGKRLRVLSLGVCLMVVFGSILVPVYDFFAASDPYKNEQHILDFFTSEKEMNKYLVNKKEATVGTTQDVRRADAIRVPLEYLAQDPVHLAFGLGLGNASNSNLGESFSGEYYLLFQKFLITSFSTFLLEIGILGTAVVFGLYWLVFSDALAVARSDSGILGAMAVGWIGAVAVMTAATFYTHTHVFASISYLYWYFSGMIAARRVQLAVPVETYAVARRLRSATH
jgi:hypothetical protein